MTGADRRDATGHDPRRVSDALVAATLSIWQEGGRVQRFPANGQSMWPLIQEGDLLWVAHGQGDWRRGDVIVLNSAGRLIAHRLLCSWGDGSGVRLLTKGDNVSQPDEPLGEAEIVGRVVRIDRGGQSLRLDTRAARLYGWTIATASLRAMTLRGWLLKHLPGAWATRPARGLRRLAAALARRLRAVLLRLIV